MSATPEKRPTLPKPFVPQPERVKRVPQERAVRDQIRQAVAVAVEDWDRSKPLDRQHLEPEARRILSELGLDDAYLGWTMVLLGSQFWSDQVAGIPFHRRLLLLPHCLRNVETCPARFNERGLLCQDCGACRLTSLKRTAEELGYQVLIAEGSPAVMQVILGGHADALLGVSCLDVLERSLDRILPAGIPCMAIPLWDSKCRDSETDEDWVVEMIRTPYQPSRLETHTYVHLLRAARRIFQPEEFEWLIPRDRPITPEGKDSIPPKIDTEGLASIDPVAATEAIAYDFLLTGGKRARPFVTLATYDAMTGGQAMGADGAEHAGEIPDVVRRVATAIEVFHKASLVHDDIEDEDAYRYGQPTVHHRFGTATAINVGDFLIGLGYRIIAGQRKRLGAAAAADIVAQLAEAHLRLCEGQGAELAWRDALNKRLSPAEALRIYSLKTSPAFEAAIYAGLRLAGPAEAYRHAIGNYAYHLGIAFQILNDLEDWKETKPNRLAVGSDALGGRPTVLWALALERLDKSDADYLQRLVGSGSTGKSTIQLHGSRVEDRFTQIESLYRKADVFELGAELVDQHHRLARSIAEKIEPTPLSNLLRYLADSILDR